MGQDIRDLVIVGAGPSALTAAIYTTRDGFDTVIYEKSAIGGIVATIDKIDNYPGFPDGISGYECSVQLEKQAKRFGAKIEFGEVQSIKKGDGFNIVTVDGIDVKTRTVLIASGCSHSKVGVNGEDEYYGRGVSYCATCDGAFYVGKRIAVVGGGNSAIQEAIYLTQFASHIDLLVRSTIKASDILRSDLEKLVQAGKVTVHLGAKPVEFIGNDKKMTGIKVDVASDIRIIEIDGVFVFVGLKPVTNFIKNSDVLLDADGFIITDSKLATNMSGVFASGDVRSGSTRQIVSAAGEGAVAAMSIREYIQDSKRDNQII